MTTATALITRATKLLSTEGVKVVSGVMPLSNTLDRYVWVPRGHEAVARHGRPVGTVVGEVLMRASRRSGKDSNWSRMTKSACTGGPKSPLTRERRR
jgi:hypothetical protein